MADGLGRHCRGLLYTQAVLVWAYTKVDARAWVERGAMAVRGEPVVLKPEQEKAVNEYVARIEKAGRFVMPEA